MTTRQTPPDQVPGDNPRPASADQCPQRAQGWFGRWLEKVARANQQSFGPGGPRCC